MSGIPFFDLLTGTRVVQNPLQGDDDVSTIIAQASFDGRLKHDEGNAAAAGDVCTLTAAASKDLYLSAAQVVFYADTTTVNTSGDEVVLKVDGAIVETAKASLAKGTTDSGNSAFVYDFRNLWHKVDATQILKLEAITLDAATEVEGVIQAVEVPDGQNPVTYTGT